MMSPLSTAIAVILSYAAAAAEQGIPHRHAQLLSGKKTPLIQFNSGNHEPVAALRSAAPVSGLAAAGSTFPDAMGGQSLDTVGSASLVRMRATGRLVALTASHVVAGEHPWVEVNGKRINAKQVLLDSDNDIAILELPPVKAEPALIFGKDGLSIAPKFLKDIDEGLVPTVILAYYLPGHALGFALRPWVNPGVETANQRAIVHAPIISMNYNGEQVRIYTKVTSGASGSAVLDLIQNRVAGVIVQSHYYLSETYLASAEVLRRHFDLYARGRRGSTSETIWRMRNRLAYRVFPGALEEANFTNQATSGILGQPGAGVIGSPGAGVIGSPGAGVIGSPGAGVIGSPGSGVVGQPGAGVVGQPGAGVVGQPGNGVIAQPGNGVIAQPGNGVIAQPGNGVIAQPAAGTSGAPGNGVIGQPRKVETFQPWLQNPSAVFDFYKIRPGMIWKDQQVIGLRVDNPGSMPGWPSEFTLLAESEAFRFMRSSENKGFKFTPFGLDTDFVALLRKRLGLKNDENVRLKTAFGPSAVADDLELQSLPDECEVRLEGEKIIVRVKTYARMNRETWELVPDEVRFTLGKNGGIEGQGLFLPVIEVKGRSGESYFVDLRQFFFTDFSQLMRPMPDWSNENPPFDLRRFDLKDQLLLVGFSVRNAASGAEFTYGFSAPTDRKETRQPYLGSDAYFYGNSKTQ